MPPLAAETAVMTGLRQAAILYINDQDRLGRGVSGHDHALPSRLIGGL